MSAIFADTSALTKRYVPETGSAWVRSWIEPVAGNTVFVSEVAIVELPAALARRRRDGSVSPTEFSQLLNDFLLHAEREYSVIGLESQVLRQASLLVAMHPIRTLDAIQLACALACVSLLGRPPLVVSADRTLLAAAAAEGLPTDDPNLHP